MKKISKIIPAVGFLAFLLYLYVDKTVVYNVSFQIAVLFCLACILWAVGEKIFLTKAALLSIGVLFLSSIPLYLLYKTNITVALLLFFGGMLTTVLLKRYNTSSSRLFKL